MLRSELDQFKEQTIAKALRGECEGACEEHVGEVKPVRVTHGNTDWGWFSYCQEARNEDERRGMTVNVYEENDDDS